MKSISFAALTNLSVQLFANHVRAMNLRRRLRNTERDIELSRSRIANCKAVIAEENKAIGKQQKNQAIINSDLLQLERAEPCGIFTI